MPGVKNKKGIHKHRSIKILCQRILCRCYRILALTLLFWGKGRIYTICEDNHSHLLMVLHQPLMQVSKLLHLAILTGFIAERNIYFRHCSIFCICYADPASPIASCRQPQAQRTRGFVAAKVVAEKVASVSRKDHSTGPKNMFSQPRVHESKTNHGEVFSEPLLMLARAFIRQHTPDKQMRRHQHRRNLHQQPMWWVSV